MTRNLLVSSLPPLSLLGALAFPPGAAWVPAAICVVSSGVVMDGLLRPGSRLFGPGLRHGAPQPRVALTFDDGPHPSDTPAILDILEETGVRSTFFFVGKKARAHPDPVRRAARLGNEVECHSDSHPWWFSLAGPRRIKREVSEAGRTLEDLSGLPIRFFRPPMGHNNIFLQGALESAGIEKVLWSTRSFDTLRRSPERIRNKVLDSAAPGGIILLHEGVRRSSGGPSGTVSALSSIIRGLREIGLEPVPLGRLRAAP
jgi:peptidoglycan/xylan/chitin deacetylase (PgdA/CDA1 family)